MLTSAIRSLLVLACATAAACSSASELDLSLAPDVPRQEVGVVEDFVLEYVRLIGPGAVPDSFTYQGPAAISRSGRIAAFSRAGCTTVVVDARSNLLDRQFGRCGDGPNEHRGLTAIGWVGDTIFRIGRTWHRMEFLGAGDTTVRVASMEQLLVAGVRNVQGFTVLDDTTALLVATRRAASSEAPANGWFFARADLRTGELRPLAFRESARRLRAIEETNRFYYGCTHRDAPGLIIANNGPAELIGTDADGHPTWSRTLAVPAIRALEQPTQTNTAAFIWNHLPRRVVCSATLAIAPLVPLDGTGMSAPLGHFALLEYDGTVRMHVPLAVTDSAIALGRWFADDSLFYVATPDAANSSVVVFRVRERRTGERGAFAIPAKVEAYLNGASPEPPSGIGGS